MNTDKKEIIIRSGRESDVPAMTDIYDEIGSENIHRVYGLITVPNEGSIALHTRFGFKQAGLFDEAGMELGPYRTVALFEKKMT